MSQEFSLTTELLPDGPSIFFERDSDICENRQEIIQYSEVLGCTAKDRFTIQVADKHTFDKLQVFIANLTATNTLRIYLKNCLSYFMEPSDFLFDNKALLIQKAIECNAKIKFNRFYFDDKECLKEFIKDFLSLKYLYEIKKIEEK